MHVLLSVCPPLSKPLKRNGGRGVSARALPRAVIAWLDQVAPLADGTGWLSHAMSAITEQQQFTGFDCGVACLLYAEKAAQQQAWQDIRAFTNQAEISQFRETLHEYFNAVGLAAAPAPAPPPCVKPQPGPGRSRGRTGSKGRGRSRSRGRSKGRFKKAPDDAAALAASQANGKPTAASSAPSPSPSPPA